MLALVAGWEPIVASVGDSAAFLDTGKVAIALSGNHRIDDNVRERARTLAAGGRAAVGSEGPAAVPVCLAQPPSFLPTWLRCCHPYLQARSASPLLTACRWAPTACGRAGWP